MPRVGYGEIVLLKIKAVATAYNKEEYEFEPVTEPFGCVIDTVGVTETYQAMTVGVSPSAKLKIRAAEFNESLHRGFRFNGRDYKIIRTQPAGKGWIYLVGE